MQLRLLLPTQERMLQQLLNAGPILGVLLQQFLQERHRDGAHPARVHNPAVYYLHEIFLGHDLEWDVAGDQLVP